MRDRAQMARAIWTQLEPIHAVTYFAPEAAASFTAAGYRGFWMGYFAGRSAPLGEAPAEVVHALFYNFSFEHVRRALPDAWQFAPPPAALTARLEGAVSALRRYLGADIDEPSLERAADLAQEPAMAAPLEGRALFAANRSLPTPTSPLARLWHQATLLREHRGDGHVAALTAAGISGRQAHVIHSLSSGTPADVYATARRFTGQEWDDVTGSLRDRGLIGDAGDLTTAGLHLKSLIEKQTDDLAASAYAALSDSDLDALHALLRPVARAVVASGELPRRSPMGLDLDEVLT